MEASEENKDIHSVGAETDTPNRLADAADLDIASDCVLDVDSVIDSVVVAGDSVVKVDSVVIGNSMVDDDAITDNTTVDGNDVVTNNLVIKDDAVVDDTSVLDIDLAATDKEMDEEGNLDVDREGAVIADALVYDETVIDGNIVTVDDAVTDSVVVTSSSDAVEEVVGNGDMTYDIATGVVVTNDDIVTDDMVECDVATCDVVTCDVVTGDIVIAADSINVQDVNVIATNCVENTENKINGGLVANENEIVKLSENKNLKNKNESVKDNKLEEVDVDSSKIEDNAKKQEIISPSGSNVIDQVSVSMTSEIKQSNEASISSSLSDHMYSRNPSLQKSENLKRQRIDDISADAKKTKLCNVDVTQKRKRQHSAPSLNAEHMEILLYFLSNPEELIHDSYLRARVKESKIPRMKKIPLSRQLRNWQKMLTQRKVDGKTRLCLRNSKKKLILASEEYENVIEEAHLGVGRFIWSTSSKDKMQRVVHNGYHKTLELIETDYGVGGREFGMSKCKIYEYIANCKKCSYEAKKLPPLSKIVHTNTSMTSTVTDGQSNSTPVDYDELNESRKIDLSDAPISMIWEQPTSESIWYNQKGLANEQDQYKKLLGLVQELGLNLGSTVQGNSSSKDKLATKIYCLQQLITDMKKRCELQRQKHDESTFLADYIVLQQKYVEMRRLDLFLYDINLLAIKYKLSKHEQFMKVVNQCVSQFTKKDNTKKDLISKFNSPITIEEHFLLPRGNTQLPPTTEAPQPPYATMTTQLPPITGTPQPPHITMTTQLPPTTMASQLPLATQLHAVGLQQPVITVSSDVSPARCMMPQSSQMNDESKTLTSTLTTNVTTKPIGSSLFLKKDTISKLDQIVQNHFLQPK